MNQYLLCLCPPLPCQVTLGGWVPSASGTKLWACSLTSKPQAAAEPPVAVTSKLADLSRDPRAGEGASGTSEETKALEGRGQDLDSGLLGVVSFVLGKAASTWVLWPGAMPFQSERLRPPAYK